MIEKMRHNRRGPHDRLSDIARAHRSHCNRIVGGFVISAIVIPFLPRNQPRSGVEDSATAFSAEATPDDLVMDHADAVVEIRCHREDQRDETFSTIVVATDFFANALLRKRFALVVANDGAA
jgi:hypothetical protein